MVENRAEKREIERELGEKVDKKFRCAVYVCRNKETRLDGWNFRS